VRLEVRLARNDRLTGWAGFGLCWRGGVWSLVAATAAAAVSVAVAASNSLKAGNWACVVRIPSNYVWGPGYAIKRGNNACMYVVRR